MARGASESPAARRGTLVFLVAISVLAGELTLEAHGAGFAHVEPGGDAAELVASCSLCEFEAVRRAEPRPSPLHGIVTPLPFATPLPPAPEPDGSQSARLASPAGPRAPPSA